ncbi:BatD family protein [Candidatus Scalindua japonica]|nr:BatD family protein [Candidatus Scalindua japonica]
MTLLTIGRNTVFIIYNKLEVLPFEILKPIKVSMKNIIRYKIIIFIAMLFTYAEDTCQAQGVLTEESSKQLINVNANVDMARVTIGDKINYKITIDFPEDVEVFPPETKDKIGGLTVKEFTTEDIEEEEGRTTREYKYILETYKASSYIIPSFEIEYKEKLKSEVKMVKTTEIFVEVVTILDADASDVRDIKPPVALHKNYYKLYVIIGIIFGVLVLAAVIAHYIYHRKHREVESIPEPLSSHQIAYNDLESLRAMDLISKGQIKEYYYRLSNIVRYYIENRFKLMAPERTTEEFLLEMTVTGKLSGEHKELVGNFLEHCDMVKFAAYGPDSREIENSFNSAKKLVDETREIVQEESVVQANVNQIFVAKRD